MMYITKDTDGFTLIELMIAIAIAAILVSAIYVSVISQQKTQFTQQMVVDIQQNARAALFLLQREIRMAGFDPTWDDGNDDGLDDKRRSDSIDNNCDGIDEVVDVLENTDLAGITQADASEIEIRLDRDSNGDFCGSNELIAFGFPGRSDGNGDGVADDGAAQLKRGFKGNSLNQPVAENIQAVAFAYAFDWDGTGTNADGKLDTIGGNIIWAYDSNGNGDLDMALDTNNDGVINAADDTNRDGFLNDSPISDPAPLNAIRAVRLWLLARSRAPIRDYADTDTYIVGNKILIPGDSNGNGVIDGNDAPDSYKRGLLATIVHCRNLGLR
jgi:type IV pilus assembly protein PilW